ncbi:hypothetical protein BDZ89DRAFT_1064656, partial [Hymenopellis radicata]
ERHRRWQSRAHLVREEQKLIRSLSVRDTPRHRVRCFWAYALRGDAMMDLKHSSRSMPFFLLQAAGIVFEQTVIGTGKHLGIAGSGWRLVGFMWVGLWFSFSAVQYIDSVIQAGMLDAEALPFSPIRFVQGRLGL